MMDAGLTEPDRQTVPVALPSQNQAEYETTEKNSFREATVLGREVEQ
jgi:hypothetical protein